MHSRDESVVFIISHKHFHYCEMFNTYSSRGFLSCIIQRMLHASVDLFKFFHDNNHLLYCFSHSPFS